MHLGLNRGNDVSCDFVLKVEDIGQLAVIAFRPDVPAGGAVDQQRRHSDPVAGFTDTAFQHVPHTQLVGHPLHINVLAFVGKGRVPGDDEEPGRA